MRPVYSSFRMLSLLSLLVFATLLPVTTAASPNAQSGDPYLGESSNASFEGTNTGALPLSFIPNAGQTDLTVRFLAYSLGGTIYFAPGEVALWLPSETPNDDQLTSPELLSRSRGPSLALPTVVHLRFVDANPPLDISPAGRLPGIANYMLGTDASQWHTNLPTYDGIVYQQLYPGIDLHYQGTSNQLKSTYRVAPGSDPGLIRWRYDGATGVRVNEAGALVVTLPISNSLSSLTESTSTIPRELLEHAPVAWQEVNGQRVPVAASYALAPDGSIGFTLGAYDLALPLVIDPTLTYSTYYGGSEWDRANGIAVDRDGSAYFTGFTRTSKMPLLPPELQQPSMRGFDVFVVKLNPRGSAYVYNTHFGGQISDWGEDIVVDGNRNAYITGGTLSPDYPTTPFAFDMVQNSVPGGESIDGFVTKLSVDGTSFVYSTYLGGGADDEGHAIAIYNTFAYVAGFTMSSTFPTSPGASDTTYNGEGDVFVAQLNHDGSALNYGTYLGGRLDDVVNDIAVGNDANAYVTGRTRSIDFPMYHALDSSMVSTEAFVSRLNSTGTQLVYSTYLGGDSSEEGNGVTVRTSSAYVAGETSSSNFPVSNALDGVRAGTDAFVSRLDWNGTALSFGYSTYLGGSSTDRGLGIGVDNGGYASVTGLTFSTDFPTRSPVQSANGGKDDVFVLMLSPAGQKIIHSTYLGGRERDYSNGVSVDRWGHAYVTGYTESPNFPVANAPESTFGGWEDAFVAKVEAQSTLLSWFQRYPNVPTSEFPEARTVAQRTDVVVLNKKSTDQTYLNDLREFGYHGLALQYVLANEIQDPAGVEDAPFGNQWAYDDGDYAWINLNRPEWFLAMKKDGVCSRIPKTSDGYYHADPGSSSWRKYAADRAYSFVHDLDGRGEYDFDGLFLDNVDVTWSGVYKDAYGNNNPGQSLYRCTTAACDKQNCVLAYTSGDAYVEAVRGFVQAIRARLDQSTAFQPYLFGNMIADNYSGTSWDLFMQDPVGLDGGMYEAWVTGYCPGDPCPSGHDLTQAQQDGVLTQAASLLAAGKSVMAVGQGPKSNTTRQRFGLASYLLVVPEYNRGQGTYRYTSSEDPDNDGRSGYREWWYYSNYDYKLGRPLGSRYRPGGSTTKWRRDFEHGYVEVDQAARTGSIVPDS